MDQTIMRLLLKLLLLCISSASIHCEHLSVYQVHRFEPNNNEALYHVTTHNTTGDIYIGAHNALYRLSEDFTIIATVSTCSSADDDCDNVNKILAIDYDHNILITCGGGNNGRCEARSVVDLSLDGSDFVEMIVSGLSAVGLIAPALNGYKMENVLYVSSGHTSLDVVNYYRYVNARRYLEITPRFGVKDGAQPDNTYISQGKKINFKAAFSFKEYTYFAAFRQNFDEDVFLSRLSRVCHDNTFDTLSEIYLRCVAGDVDYNLIQSMSVGPAGHDLAVSLDLQAGEDILYGLFAEDDGSGHPTGQSVLCLYKWDEIEDAFFKALNGCLTAYESLHVSHQLNYAAGASCSTNRLDLSVADVMFYMCPDDDRDLYRRYSQGVYTEAAVSQAVLAVDKTFTSVTTAVEENHTIAFLCTDDGQLMKFKIVNESSARVYEIITLDAGQQIRSDTFLDKRSNYLMVLTEKKLLKLQVANCSQFTTCDECIRPNGEQDGDPYCGWCTLEKMCTRFKECKSSSWLPSNTAQCIQITNVEPPFIPYTDENIKVALTVEQLPPLNINQSYGCKFGDFVSPGMKDGEIITCISPPATQVPQIPTGEAAVEVSLSVHSSQTDVDFVTTQFSFFDCSAITSCSECVTSFTCDWCLYGNKCTHNASVLCSGDDQVILNGNTTVTPAPGGMHGHESCPHILRQTNEELIHVNVQKEVRIAVKNLPDASKVLSGYTCVFTIEGKTSTIQASVEEATTTIVCSQYTFDYTVEDQELNANIQVVWNDNNFIDNTYKVTLYKCSVLRPDCSRCLSNDTTRPELDCIWCGDQCLYDSFCSSEVNDCPAPVITQIMPPSVATVTNQPEPDYTEVIELFGTDFGQMSSDIASIMIGSKECEKIADGFNINLQSVKCKAPVFSTANQRNVIISAQGKTSAPGSITYQNPSISDISPKFGIKAGGTKVTITGALLETGQDLMVSMGISECEVTNVSETQILCTTSPHTAETELMVTVTFGQASRDAATFTYTANPTVADFQPKSSIKAGGRKINVTGINFQYVQRAKMLVNGVSAERNCKVSSNEMMVCESPPVDLSSSGQRSRRQADDSVYSLTFSFDGFVPELSDEFEFAVYPDPIYYPFSNETEYGLLVEDGIYKIDTKSTSLIQLMGSGIDLATDSDVSDVKVLIGGVECIVNSLTDTTVLAEAPDEEPDPVNGGDHPLVVIHHGNLVVTFGPISYPVDRLSINIIIVIAMCAVVTVIIFVSILVYCHRSRSIARQREEATVKFFTQPDFTEKEAPPEEEVNLVIVDPNTGYMDITENAQNTQNRFQSRGRYIHCMLFLGCKMIPQAVESRYTSLEKGGQGLLDLSKLLVDKKFILKLVEILDEDPSVTRLERQNFAALFLMSMIADNEFGHLIDVLEILLRKHVENKVKSKKRKQVLNRTETVIGQLISHWMALCLYRYTMDFVSDPLYQLVEAIRTRIEGGVVDAINHRCQYSLDEKYLLSSDVIGEDIYLKFIVDEEKVKQELVRVNSCDTLLQVKEKLLNVMFMDQPFSRRPKATQVKLEWRVSREERIILQDNNDYQGDSQTKKRMKTIQDFGIHNNAMVAFVNTWRDVDTTSGVYDKIKQPTVPDPGNNIYESIGLSTGDGIYHILEDGLIKEETDEYENMERRRKSVVDKSELARLTETKEVYQQHVNSMFEAIFSSSSQQRPLPSCVKYLFDFLDNLASNHDISINDLKIWKNNSFAEIFWVRILTHPDFICDIQQTTPIDVTLGVISKVFQDSWSTELFSFNENSPSHRQVYVTEIPRYRQLVTKFYSNIMHTSPCNRGDVIDEVQSLLHPFRALINRSSVLENLYSFIDQHFNDVKYALIDDESCRVEGTVKRLEQVALVLSKGRPSSH